MAIDFSQIPVQTGGTELITAGPNGAQVHVKLPSGAEDVYLGGSLLTTVTGFLMEAGDILRLDLHPSEALWGTVVTTTTTVYVLTAHQP